jgi:outer membrane protein OmpA-like peptidoglycan-associated protein
VSVLPQHPSEFLCRDWQQVKTAVYNFNLRHTYQQKNMPRQRGSLTTIQIIDTLVIPDVLFATSKSSLNSKSFKVLNAFCEKLKRKQIDSLISEGHTDSRGTLEFNQQLSKNRAETVAAYIEKKIQLGKQFIITRHWDWQKPVARNDTPGGRQQNRRVNVYVYFRE